MCGKTHFTHPSQKAEKSNHFRWVKIYRLGSFNKKEDYLGARVW